MAQIVRHVVIQPQAPRMVQLAASEVRRYVYLRAGLLPEIQRTGTPASESVVIAIK
ncbi:MAG: hypothetical protein HC801_10800, partial [Nitrospira sp.]|nr:hypothetical protein [Nitrospira sp.]